MAAIPLLSGVFTKNASGSKRVCFAFAWFVLYLGVESSAHVRVRMVKVGSISHERDWKGPPKNRCIDLKLIDYTLEQSHSFTLTHILLSDDLFKYDNIHTLMVLSPTATATRPGSVYKEKSKKHCKRTFKAEYNQTLKIETTAYKHKRTHTYTPQSSQTTKNAT